MSDEIFKPLSKLREMKNGAKNNIVGKDNDKKTDDKKKLYSGKLLEKKVVHMGDDDETREVTISEITKQEVLIWVRVYLKEELDDISEGDVYDMVYEPSGESMKIKFGAYDKRGLTDKKVDDGDDEVSNYKMEDDKKALCFMVDLNKINYDSEDIPFIRTLFRGTRYYEYNVFRIDDLSFINKQTGKKLIYHKISF